MKRSPKIRPPASARLFSDANPAAPPAGVHVAYIDGASRGNPGPAAYAVIIRDPDGKVVLELPKKLGIATNNVAEYYALLAALECAASHGIAALRVRSDSELLVRQMKGEYKVKHPDLKPLHERAQKLCRQLAYFAIEHVRREMNRDADALANLALDRGDSPKSSHQDAQTKSPAQRLDDGADASPRSLALAPRTIRARFVNGALVPSEPLDLPEGSEVFLTLRKPQ